MPGRIVIDISVGSKGWPGEPELAALAERVVDAAASHLGLSVPKDCELSLLFTDDARIRELNAEWRGKDGATNVLSFPAFPIGKGGRLPPMLGDIVLARETIAREAEAGEKPFDQHLAHLIVHGFLHLVGYDHETDGEAEEMEEAERRVLMALAIPDPYA